MTDIGRMKRRLMLRLHEGCVAWIYPDRAGNPTVGVGHLLRTLREAIALPFVVAETRQPATRQQIAAAWASVRHMRKPYKALILRDPDINKLLDADIDEREPIMERTFGGVELPESVELGLWDILFNTGGFEGWPKLTAAVRAGDWATAAKESKRIEGDNGVSATRNETTRELFLAALKPQPQEVNA